MFLRKLSSRRSVISPGPGVAVVGLPLDGNLINVKDYGAIGNGVTDDTAAILLAIAAIPQYSIAHSGITKIVYFPAGTYLVSNTIQRIIAGNKVANLVLIGEAKATTTIQLANSASGYGVAKAVIAMHSGNYFGQSPDPSAGEGNEAFNNTIENLTISIGTGNAGAVAVDYVCNNYGVIRNVDIVALGACATAISMARRYAGPSLISNVAISGPFAVGVDVANPEYSMVLEHVTITGTTTVGLRNTQNSLSLRDVTITTTSGYGVDITDATGAAIATPWGPNEGLIVWVDGVISGNGTAALHGTGGSRNFSNVNSVGFNGGGTVSLAGVYRVGDLTGTSNWQLTVQDTPLSSGGLWKKITAPLAPIDATSAIQAACADSAATVLYLPTGTYYTNGTITVADNIERIEFMYSVLQAHSGFVYQFAVNTTRTKDLFIRRLIVEDVFGIAAVVNWRASSPARLIITDTRGPNLFERQIGATGEVYLENNNNTHIVLYGSGGTCWARQLNPEAPSAKLYNTNGNMWILGLKTENQTTALLNDGGTTEILGGQHYPGNPAFVDLWTNSNSGCISAAYVTDALGANLGWTTEETSTINGITNTILTSSLYQRGAYNGRNVPRLSTRLFVPSIDWSDPTVAVASGIGVVVDTAVLTSDYSYTGTPVWALTSNPGGKYAINSSTGVVTVAAALSLGIDTLTIDCSGSLTFGANGTPVVTPITAYISVVTVSPCLNTLKQAAGITLSGNNLIATANATNANGQMVLSSTRHSTGKYVVKATNSALVGASSTIAVGFANGTQRFTNGHFLGESTSSIGLFGNGSYYKANAGTFLGVNFSSTTVYCAVNIDTGKVWFSNDGATLWNNDVIGNQNPATGTGGIAIGATGSLYFGVECDVTGNQITVDFAPATRPAGFSVW